MDHIKKKFTKDSDLIVVIFYSSYIFFFLIKTNVHARCLDKASANKQKQSTDIPLTVILAAFGS